MEIFLKYTYSIEDLELATTRINLVAAIDSSGRGGNLFFLTIFDLHPEVVCCPIVQYSYSYILEAFGENDSISAKDAHNFIINRSYFRMLYNELEGENKILFERMGGNSLAEIDRPELRKIIDDYFLSRDIVSRREVLVVPMIAYAIVRGLNVNDIRYLLIGDAISQRAESVLSGFSGRIVNIIIKDFPDAKILRLVRDPRATFASPRHQFVNSLGNMYAVRPGNYFKRLAILRSLKLTPENGCVYLYWLLYLRQTELAICSKEQEFPTHFMPVKNEDLNLHFPKTMASIAKWLNVRMLSDWTSSNFLPTVMGLPWLGAGAYNSRYQLFTNGLLKNDDQTVSIKVTGPNEYVTKRWRLRLNSREIELIEYLFFNDLKKYEYEILHHEPERGGMFVIIRTLIGPFEGELPRLSWIFNGFGESLKEGFNRLFYALTFPPFYILSRIMLIKLAREKFFTSKLYI